jgi:hypothetical protein
MFSKAAFDLDDNKISCHGLAKADETRGGASSNTIWAFVPPIPNELTPARLGVAVLFQGRSSVFTKNGLFSKSIFGLGRSK